MNTSRTAPVSTPPALPNTEARSALRTKTVATRLTPEELAEVEEAAERDGKTLAEWVREQALKSARQVPADPIELVLSEIAAVRYMLLTLFHSTAQARREGVDLLPETVLQIRDAADRRKLQTARKMLDDFMNLDVAGGQP
jgi:uncharacterized protein (DUF1778 family)